MKNWFLWKIKIMQHSAQNNDNCANRGKFSKKKPKNAISTPERWKNWKFIVDHKSPLWALAKELWAI